VPAVLDGPFDAGGSTWCLFERRPGESILTETAADQRARGRLLAKLHEATAGMTDLGQRRSFTTVDCVVSDPNLETALRQYEVLRPRSARILRWHRDKALEYLSQCSTNDMETLIIHGDFAPWNLLFEGKRLSGVLDFEAAHRDFRVSDFALSWRGHHDDVIRGYREIRDLSIADRQLLVPVYWSWLFLDVPSQIEAMVAGSTPTHGLNWEVEHLLRRSSEFSREYPACPW